MRLVAVCGAILSALPRWDPASSRGFKMMGGHGIPLRHYHDIPRDFPWDPVGFCGRPGEIPRVITCSCGGFPSTKLHAGTPRYIPRKPVCGHPKVDDLRDLTEGAPR